MTLLILATAPAWAEWVKVYENATAVFYVDPTTIRKDGHHRRLWELQDMKGLGQKGMLSLRNLNEYNCKDELVRPLALSGHSGHMATGVVLGSGMASGESDYVAPDTPNAVVLKFVCDR